MAEFGKALSRGLDILETLGQRGQPMTYAAIGERVRVSQASFTRFLKILLRRGYVVQDERGRYRLGWRLAYLGQAALQDVPLLALVRPHLRVLAGETGECAEFAVFQDDGYFQFLERVESPKAVVLRARPGSRFPVGDGTAIGRVALAYGCRASDGARLAVRTARTVRKAGWAEMIQNRGEAYRIAAPVFDRDDSCIGAVVIAAPAFRARAAAKELFRKHLVAHARELSREVGGNGSSTEGA
jgi:DNA-binding IclR family transcriptional regulator